MTNKGNKIIRHKRFFCIVTGREKKKEKKDAVEQTVKPRGSPPYRGLQLALAQRCIHFGNGFLKGRLCLWPLDLKGRRH